MMKRLLFCVLFISQTLTSIVASLEQKSFSADNIKKVAVECQRSSSLTFDDQIPKGGFTIIPLEKDNDGKLIAKLPVKNTGAGIARALETQSGMKLILGKRFGLHWKLVVGGQVEDNETSPKETVERELKEEWFGQLLLSPKNKILNNGNPMVAGGMHIDRDGTITSKSWGPYITFFSKDAGYTDGEIQEAQKIMNSNAALHFALADFFSKKYDTKSVDDKKREASELLDRFKKVSHDKNIIQMNPKVKEALESIVHSGNFTLESNINTFAREYIHDYSEYSEFRVVDFKDMVGEVEQDLKREKQQRHYFAPEDDARRTFINLLKK